MENRQPPTLFQLDEFATLGRFKIISEALGRMRGYGLKFQIFVQTLGQLKELYGEGWQTIMGNAGVVQYFGGTSDIFTAETISKLCGTTTRVKRGISDPGNPGNMGGESYSTYARPLLTPDEVMRLRMPSQLLLTAGRPPCLALLFDPNLGAFPDYLAFQLAIKKGTTIPEAIRFARDVWADRQREEQQMRAAAQNKRGTGR